MTASTSSGKSTSIGIEFLLDGAHPAQPEVAVRGVLLPITDLLSYDNVCGDHVQLVATLDLGMDLFMVAQGDELAIALQLQLKVLRIQTRRDEQFLSGCIGVNCCLTTFRLT